MDESTAPDVLLRQLGDAKTDTTHVRLDGRTCDADRLQTILDAMILRGSKNEDIQAFSLCDVKLESEIFNKLCDSLVLMKQLRELTLAAIGLSANAVRKLCKILSQYQHLSSLSLAGNRKLGPRGIKILSDGYLSKCKTLTHLDLSQTSVGHYGAQALALPISLQTLLLQDNSMGHDGIWKLAESLQALEHLNTLNLGSNNCLDDGCLEIAKNISYWQHLRHLNLADNDIGDVGAEVLAREMEESHVRELYLQDNQIADAGSAHIAERLLHMPNLQVLNLANNKLHDAGCVSIARGLVFREDENSESEYGSDNDEDDEDGTETADVDLDDDASQQESARDKAKPAKFGAQTKLKVLNLSGNQIGDGGAGAFVELLDDIPSLRVLDLSENQVSEARTRILDVLLKHRQHDQQRMESESKPRTTIPMSPTPQRPMRPKSALEDVSFDLTEADEDKDDEDMEATTMDGFSLLKEALEKPVGQTGAAVDLPPDYFNYLTGNFAPKRIQTYSALGNLYYASDDRFDDADLVIRSLYMHTAGALDEVRASVVAELNFIQHDNIMKITAQLLGPSLYCFLHDVRDYKSLSDILGSEYDRKLWTWDKRAKVLSDIARALEYCHGGGGARSRLKPSFHGDVHPKNVFVSDDFSVAKLSGCGLSRLIATDRSRFYSGDAVFGSRGYRCCRYERGSCQYDAASDMFSYGIIAAEILTGCLQGSRKSQSGLSNDVLFDNLFGDNPFEADPRAGPVVNKPALEAIGRVAATCMSPAVASRPSASMVIQVLLPFSQVPGNVLRVK